MLTNNIRHELWLSATILFGRQIISASLSLVTIVLALHFIGPIQYGTFVSAATLISIVCAVCSLGVGAYLLRNPLEPDTNTYHQAFTLLFMAGIVAVGVGLFLIEDISNWVGVQGLSPLAFALLFSVPIVIVSRVPQCKIERGLDYRRVAKVELAATICRFFLTLVFFVAGGGVWSLVFGWWGFHSLTLLGYLYQGNYIPKLYWRIAVIQPMLSYGIKTWFARMIFNLRDLANPLIAAKILGAEAVAIISIVTNLCEATAIGLGVSQRISGGVFGKFQRHKEKLSSAISEGTFFQVFIVGSFQLIILLIGQTFSSYLDPVWRSAFLLLPYFSVYYLVLALIQLRVSALYTLNKTKWIVFINLVYVSTLMITAYAFSLEDGINGYGIATAMSSFLLLTFLYQRGTRKSNDLLMYSIITAVVFILVLFWITSIGSLKMNTE